MTMRLQRTAAAVAVAIVCASWPPSLRSALAQRDYAQTPQHGEATGRVWPPKDSEGKEGVGESARLDVCASGRVLAEKEAEDLARLNLFRW